VIQGVRAFYDVASMLVTGVGAELTASPAGTPERACVVPGEIAWDECDCGMLAVSPRAWTVTDSFPETTGFGGAATPVSPCTAPWLVGTIELQVIRCAPSPDGNVLSVSCERLDVAAEVLVADAYLTLTTTISILCELKSDEQIVDYVVGEQLTVGPQGGCVGTSLTVQVSVDR
jgi:hypothetical protein